MFFNAKSNSKQICMNDKANSTSEINKIIIIILQYWYK